MNAPHLFCFGLGYTGTALAHQLIDDGWRVSGTCREPSQIDLFTSFGISAFEFSGTEYSDGLLNALRDSTHVLSTVPPSPDTGGDPVWRVFGKHLGGMTHLEWIGYLSTTGVYGDTGGEEVTEAAPPAPTGARGERRVAAEQAWLSLNVDHDLPGHVFRLPGIYGPGRSALDQARNHSDTNPKSRINHKSRRILKPGHLFNRIHVDDIVQTLCASTTQPNGGAIYNVCDDEPATPADVTTFACGLAGVTPPPLVPFDEAKETMSDMALSFWCDNRRVSNARIKDELGVELLYPTYRDGLTAIWAEELGA